MQDLVFFLKFIFATAGFSYLVTKSSAFQPFRKLFKIYGNIRSLIRKRKNRGIDIKKRIPTWILIKFAIHKLLHCPLCIGFWAGIKMYYVMQFPELDILVWAFIGSIWSWIVYVMVGD